MIFKIATVTISLDPGESNIGCGGTFDNVQHTINTPNYPGNYGSLERCHWRIEASSGARIQLQFESFDTERTFDKLNIYDGSSTNSLNLGPFHGGGSTPSPKVSTGSQMYLTWSTDGSGFFSGFKINVKASFYGKYNYMRFEV